MKVLLVDDEKHVRDAIRLLVNWQQHGIDTILEAPDGESATELIARHRPEIIMTDMMMPIMNGVKLLEWLQANAPDSKTIVISGHDDFSLLRHTLKYGGTDYILKPIDPDQLNEALDKAIQAWNKEEELRQTNRELNIEMNTIKPMYWDKLLSGMIAEPSTYDSVAEQLDKALHLNRNISECRVAILSLDTMERSVKNKFSQNMDLLFFSLINICNEFLTTDGRGYAFRHWHSETEIVLLLWKDLLSAEAYLEKINEGMRTTLHSRVDFGIGRVHAFPADLTLSYQEARDALRKRNLKAKETWIHSMLNPAKSPQPALTFSHYEEKINLAIRSGSIEQIEEVIQLWMDSVKQSEVITLEQLDHWWREYSVMKRRFVQRFFSGGSEDKVKQMLSDEPTSVIVPLDEHGILSLSQWQQELTRSIVHMSKLLLENQQKDKNVIFEIAEYLEKHYHEDVTLQDIAGRFYLSREYISRKFKQEFEVNLSDYLGQIRMSKAKVLLRNPHLRISQVAEMVGYQDEKYFSKVFKKLEGITPNEYRKTANSI
ncbi:response regulator [Paenibacillus aceris]|uniref:Two-component system response regulator YesN n=1 Tax=Paenibacillus aceris TaxID=869555 RepID=A0ABS4HWM7_9BACL|nr:response regulator [Paenibacillus aceris]MBP1962349.1 two-component system response regulator YesN [Paenibacillus aceris]NHW37168.1 response regulator [Paenibacillus aceris]